MTARLICLTPAETGELIRLLAASNLPTEDVGEQGSAVEDGETENER